MGNQTKLFYRDKPIVGLDIGMTNICVMAIDAKKGAVLAYGSVDLDPRKSQDSLDGDHAYHIKKLQSLLDDNLIGELPSGHVAMSVPSSRTYTRTFSIPTKLAKTIPDTAVIEAEQYIPIPVSSLYLDHQIIERDKDNLTVQLSGVNREIVDTFTQIAKSAGVRPVVVEPSMNSISRILKSTENASLPSVLVNIDPASSDIAVVNDGNVRVTGSVSVGGNSFTLAIAKKMQTSLENAHQLKVINGLNAGPRQARIVEAVTPHLLKITSEIERVIRYYDERTENQQKIQQLLVVGVGSNMPGVGDFITNQLLLPARIASPWQQLDFSLLKEPPRQSKPRFIVAAGLAAINPKWVRTV